MKEQAMNEMLRVVRYLRSKRNSAKEINILMRSALRAYDGGNYELSIKRALGLLS